MNKHPFRTIGALALTTIAVGGALSHTASASPNMAILAQSATAPQSQAQISARIAATMAAGQTGYDGWQCGGPAGGIAIRDRASDSGQELGRMYNGTGLHVYATHSSQANIPLGWALGYGRPNGGTAIKGYFKNAWVSRTPC